MCDGCDGKSCFTRHARAREWLIWEEVSQASQGVDDVAATEVAKR